MSRLPGLSHGVVSIRFAPELSHSRGFVFAAGASPQASANDLAAFNMGVDDANRDGFISDEEFAAWVQQPPMKHPIRAEIVQYRMAMLR